MHTCADIVSSVPFFEDAEDGFTTSLVTCLTPQVSLKGDIIVREGEVSREMYFIKSGTAQVSSMTAGCHEPTNKQTTIVLIVICLDISTANEGSKQYLGVVMNMTLYESLFV